MADVADVRRHLKRRLERIHDELTESFPQVKQALENELEEIGREGIRLKYWGLVPDSILRIFYPEFRIKKTGE